MIYVNGLWLLFLQKKLSIDNRCRLGWSDSV